MSRPLTLLVRTAAAVGVLVAGLLAVPTPASALPPNPGSYNYNLKFSHSNKCLDVPDYATGNIQLDQYTCVYQSNEYFRIEAVPGSSVLFRIRSVSSGKCLNVQGASSANSAAIIQYPCGAYINEYFFANPIGGDFYRVVSNSSGKCLNIQGGSTANSAKLIQYTCGAYANEYIHFY